MSRAGFRVAKKRCDECLFSSAKIVDDERREQVLRSCSENDSHFICHKFTVAGEDASEGACCRGFYDRDPGASNLMRIAGRLGVVEFVDFPEDS